MRIVSIFLFLAVLAACGPKSNAPDAAIRPTPTVLDTTRYINQGLDLTNSAQAALLQAVTTQMQNGGVSRALPYCHTAAGPLADSLMRTTHATLLRRTSTRWRNPQNAPDTTEAAILARFQAAVDAGQSPLPIVERHQGQVHFYRPIMLQMEACLKCHGEAISPDAQTLIHQLYPQDKAFGFRLGQLRGAWHVAWAE